MMKKSEKIRFMFVRDIKKQPVGCLAYRFDGNKIHYAISTLNPMDRFNREVGRNLAAGRLLSKPQTYPMDIGLNVPTNEAIQNVLLSMVNDTAVPNRIRRNVKATLGFHHERMKHG